MQITNFDATNIPPQQSAGKHPAGNFPFQITNTFAAPTNDNKNGKFVVEFTSPAGVIRNNYNLWHENEKTVEIARKELSALCHAVGVFQLSMTAQNLAMCGHELRGARGVMDVGPQANNPDYNEIKKVYDSQGREPGVGGAAPAPQAQGGGNWGTPAASQPGPSNPAPAANSGGWGAPQGQAQPPANQQQQPQGGQGAAPPWAR